jgi:hypothetical protein
MEEGGLPARGAWSLRSAPLGAWASCCFRSRGRPSNPRLRCSRPGRCARLLLARGRHVVFEVGENPRTPVSAALGLVAALGSSWRVDVMLFSKSGKIPEPPSPLRSTLSLRWAPSACGTAWLLVALGGLCSTLASALVLSCRLTRLVVRLHKRCERRNTWARLKRGYFDVASTGSRGSPWPKLTCDARSVLAAKAAHSSLPISRDHTTTAWRGSC